MFFREKAAYPILGLWGGPTASPNTKGIKPKVLFWVCKTLELLHAETCERERKEEDVHTIIKHRGGFEYSKWFSIKMPIRDQNYHETALSLIKSQQKDV